MQEIKSGQLRLAERDLDDEAVLGHLYLLIGPTEKPGVWHIIRETGDLERWWIDGIEEDEIVAEAE